MSAAATAYLDHRSVTVEPNTVRNDRAALGMLGAAAGDARTVGDVTTEHLQHYFNGLRRQGYSPSTLEVRRVNLQAFFEWCGRRGPDNPARGVVVAKAQRKEARAFTDDELSHLRKVATKLDRERSTPGPRSWRLWLELALGTGARMSELAALEWAAFARDAGVVRVTQQIDERGTGTKALKGKEARTALVLPEFWRFAKRNATGRVLLPQIGAGVSRFGCERWAHRFYELAGVKRTNDGWHVWRHTYARLFLERGGTMEELQRSLGHASIATTERTYAHFSPDRAAASAKGRIYAR